jgi:beta-phosphoglucomutase-like phosphatase (HAD superfamily)
VAELRAAGIECLVATTGSRAWVEPLLARHFPAGTFTLTVTGTEVTALKPDPAAYVAALEQSGLAPEAVVAVEDSRNGLVAATAAGLACVVVTNDYTRAEDFTEADLVVDGFGPGARWVAGAGAPLPGGAVTPDTLRSVLAAG